MKQTNLLKTFLLLCALVVGSTCAWADTVTFTAGTDTSDGTSITKGGITVSFSSGVFNRTDNYRCYSGASMTISSTVGNITQIDFTATSGNPMTKFSGNPDVGSWTDTSTKTQWKGDAAEINFGTTSGQCRITEIVVTYTPAVKTDPTITFNNGSVKVGKTLDLSTLFTSNSTGAVTYSITAGGTYASIEGSVLTGIAVGNVTVRASQAATIEYNAKTADATITVQAAPALSSIAITTAPTKTTYEEGEQFDATGMVVTATFADASTEDVTALCTWTPDGALTTSDTEITVSFTKNAITKTATQIITVNAYVQPTSVNINLSNTLFGVSTGNNATEQTTAVDHVTITTGCLSSASSKTYYASDHIRFYTDSYLTLTAPIGYVITGVSLNRFGTDTWNGDRVTPSTGAFEGTPSKNTDPLVWIGNANTVTFSYAGQCRTASVDVTLAKVVTATVSDAGWATYVTPYNMEFAEGDAFVVSAATASTATLAPVTKIGANKAVLLKGEGVKTATVLNEDPAAVTNKLAISTGGEIDGFVLAKKNDKVGFYKWAGGSLTSGKVYLPAPAGARDYLEFSFDETTALTLVNSEKRTVNSDIYNLAGQRVAQPTKGLYIVNGKKVVIK